MNESPMPFVWTLLDRHPGRVAVGSVARLTESGALNAPPLVVEAMARHPVTTMTDTIVFVVDEEVGAEACRAIADFDEEPLELRAGAMLEGSNPEPLVAQSRATAASLWDSLREWRQTCEETGLRVVLVTKDLRTTFGPLRGSDFFRAGRVRSHIGDAGRYHAHCRYVMECHRGDARVTMVKDEAEGLMGRVIFRDGG